MMSTLLILKGTAGDLLGREFAIPSPGQCVVGRSRGCMLRLPGDATVSRQHCIIELDPDGVWVQDLGSLNGTQVNGLKIGQRERDHDGDATMVQPSRRSLQTGDELRICSNVFRVELADTVLVRTEENSAHLGTLALCS